MEEPIQAACLDCRWGTSAYSMDDLVNEVWHHEGIYDHIVHIFD